MDGLVVRLKVLFDVSGILLTAGGRYNSEGGCDLEAEVP
jgi:hypothetical protein